MTDEELEKCEVCGAEGDPWEIEVFHRACRLKHAFPGAYREEGRLLLFDPEMMKRQMEKGED